MTQDNGIRLTTSESLSRIAIRAAGDMNLRAMLALDTTSRVLVINSEGERFLDDD